jgi:hypothetical protein
MNTFGLFAGLISLLIIALGFPLVIHSERHFGYLCWPYLMGLGILIAAGSLLARSDWASMAAGIIGAVLIWGSTELKDQAVRVERGWFPSSHKKIAVAFADIIQKWKAPHL